MTLSVLFSSSPAALQAPIESLMPNPEGRCFARPSPEDLNRLAFCSIEAAE